MGYKNSTPPQIPNTPDKPCSCSWHLCQQMALHRSEGGCSSQLCFESPESRQQGDRRSTATDPQWTSYYGLKFGQSHAHFRIYKQLTNAVDDGNRNTIRTVESRYRFARSPYWLLTDPAEGRYKGTERRNKQGTLSWPSGHQNSSTESSSDDVCSGDFSPSTDGHTTRRRVGRRHPLCCPQGGLRRPQKKPESKKEITTWEHNGTYRPQRKPLMLLERDETLISQHRPTWWDLHSRFKPRSTSTSTSTEATNTI